MPPLTNKEEIECRDLSIGICSTTPQRVVRQMSRSYDAFSSVARVQVVLDGCDGTASLQRIGELRRIRLTVEQNREQRGLSHCRNTLLAQCPTRYLLFLDDDVEVCRLAVRAAYHAFQQGAQVVGARLIMPYRIPSRARHITEGQYHYLGVHNPLDPTPKAWGAFLGVDAALAAERNLCFREDLGRLGGALQCGDDTTFVEAMKREGAKEVVIPRPAVIHRVRPSRLRFPYLLRRAWWQGRSEVRRRRVFPGIIKEIRRNLLCTCGLSRKVLLASCYTTAVALGVGTEWMLSLVKRNDTDNRFG